MNDIKTSIIEVWFSEFFNEWTINFSGIRKIGFHQFQVADHTKPSVFTDTKAEALKIARKHKESDPSIALWVTDRTTRKERLIK